MMLHLLLSAQFATRMVSSSSSALLDCYTNTAAVWHAGVGEKKAMAAAAVGLPCILF
jgi:hypothetical protein